MARDDGHFRLRIPDDVKDWIRGTAARNMRSMTAEINYALRERMRAATGEGVGNHAPAAASRTDALHGVNSSTRPCRAGSYPLKGQGPLK
ncbi:MAG: Arc family DNA-binding protein [Rhizobiaceae bacterium]|nr:Arc family DNA-binding protein [Rhizobiaceae bacterium]